MAQVVWGFSASLDGFLAGPGHDMSFLGDLPASMAGPAPEDTAALAAAVGAILSGRDGYDAALAQAGERDALTAEAYGGAYTGTEIILTHRPEELAEDSSVIAWNVDVREAVRRAKEIAGEKDVQIISADIARQALEHDLVDVLQVWTVPVFLGDGTRIFSVPGGRRVRWEPAGTLGADPETCGRLYRPRRD
ncbi:dihydrofolate reductase family protein [Brachybacterium saurashtrense]|uniref:Dihydrofolate reductase n=1 Tax=Brachybacterium saurashtrense TaxID=556288 RepID=A0A345YKR6_9MICO|nr:dihydrofolate reductase family protein [Brachybacterium saurashtrense]AXK44518.1 dihydrofolate reductase [Brachybacterium saurashtrense]RRR23130.1 dihydrofolate reductase [Brachybacterium saurashtrense]